MKQELLINSSGFVLNVLEKILNANIELKGTANIPLEHPKIYVANHFTRSEAMLIPYVLYNATQRKVGVIADDGIMKSSFGDFLENLGAMKKSEPNRNSIILNNLLTAKKDWLIFPEGRMVKTKDVSRPNEDTKYCVKVDGVCKRIHTGSAYFGINSQILRDDFLNNKIKNVKKFKRKYFLKEEDEISKLDTMIVPINVTYSNMRNGKNFLVNMATKFLADLGENMKEELEIEGNIILDSTMSIQILEPINIKDLIKHNYKDIKDKSLIVNKHRGDITNIFMTKIYEALTVNFDHIFILTLFLFPRKVINKEYFKRMLFMISKEIIKNSNEWKYYYDKSIEENLIDLISYDNFEPFENVLQLAIRDNIIKEDEDDYIFHKVELLHSYTHHEIRLKNILKVILNEVMTIKRVVNIVNSFIIKSKDAIDKGLYTYLKNEEEIEYENDYHKFSRTHDIKKKDEAKSLYLERQENRKVVICIHGFSASPLEMKELSDELHNHDLNIIMPRLRGHGTSPKDLKDRIWKDWYDSISRAITLASIKYEEIYIVGFSTGGLLTLLSSQKKLKKLKGIICINAALRLNDLRIKACIPTISFWNELVSSVNANKYSKEYVDNIPENPDINYDKHYISAVLQLKNLMDFTYEKLEKIRKPILIIQSKDDPVVNFTSAFEIYDKVSSLYKRMSMIDLDNHVIVKGKGKEKLYNDILKFIEKISEEDI